MTTLRQLIAASIIAAIALMAACSAPSAEEQDKNWSDSADLVNTSDRVLTAVLLQEVRETVQELDASGQPGASHELFFREFEVVETFVGTQEQGDSIWVAFDTSPGAALVAGTGDAHTFAIGRTYALFLKGRLRPELYPPDYGAVLWTGNGQPSLAVVEGENLLFLAEQSYLELLRDEGLDLPVGRSAAPFVLTVPGLRELTD